MEIDYNNFLIFLQKSTSTDQTSIDEARSVADNFVNVVCIPFIFEALKTSTSPNIRQLCVILFRRIRISYAEQFDENMINEIIQNFIQIIPNESQFIIRTNIIEELVEFQQFNPEQIFEFALELIKNPGFVSTGLVLILKILGFEEYQEQISQLLPNFQQFFFDNDPLTRTNAYKIFDNALFNMAYAEVLEEIEWLPEAAIVNLNRVCTANVSFDECKAILGIFEQSLSSSSLYSGFDENRGSIYEILANTIANDGIPINIRLYIIQIIDDLFEESVAESFSDSFQNCVNFAIHVYNQLFGAEDYKIPIDLLFTPYFHQIYDQNFKEIVEIINPLFSQEEEAEISIGLYIFSELFRLCECSLPNASNYASQIINDVTEYCVNFLGVDNENIVTNAAYLAQRLFISFPDEMQQHITTVCNALGQNITFMPNINTLSVIFASSTVPPENYMEILAALVDALSQAQKHIFADSLIKCIGCLIEIIPQGHDEELSQLLPILEQLMQTGERMIICPSLECYSSLCGTAPNVIAPIIPNIVEFIVSLGKDANVQILASAFSVLTSFAGFLPEAVAPQLQEIDQFLMETIEKLNAEQPHKQEHPVAEEEEEEFEEEENQGEEEEETNETSVYDEIAKAEAHAIRALGELIASFPNQFQHRFQFLLTMIKELEGTSMPEVVRAAVTTAVPFAIALRKLNHNASEVLMAVLNAIPVANTLDDISIIWESIGNVIDVLDPSGISPCVGIVGAFAAKAIGCEEIETTHDFNSALYEPVLNALQYYCERGGAEAAEDAVMKINYLVNLVQESENTTLSALLSPAAAACAAALQNEELLSVSFNFALNVLQSAAPENLYKSALDCLIIILRSYPQALAEHAESIIARTYELVSQSTPLGTAAVSLLMSFTIFMNRAVNDEECAKLVDLFNFKADSRYLNIAVLFLFKCAATNQAVFNQYSLQMSITCLSADEHYRRGVPDEIMQQCVHVVGTALQNGGEPNIRELLGFNQRLYLNLSSFFQ